MGSSKRIRDRHVIADPYRVALIALGIYGFGMPAEAAQFATGLAGGTVAAGQATITTRSLTQTVIQQTSNRAVYNWTEFSIPVGSSVQFIEPGASSIALNRVTGGSGSFIGGSLAANGQVILINNAGIIVGAQAQITAAGLILSTADIGSFKNGTLTFSGNSAAGISNAGTITITGGSAILAGETVSNSGVITARLGQVVLAGTTTYALDFNGDGLLEFAVTQPAAQPAPGTSTQVDNSGTLSADGGEVLMTAQAAKDVLDNVINTSGIVEATSVANVNGKIVLLAQGGGTAVSGTLDASGTGAGQTGGTVAVTGGSVLLSSGALVNVSGDAAGGSAFIGGNFHGQGPLPNAQATTLAAGATIDADAVSDGNGGQVAVWSNGATNVAGATITARGGANGGNGGQVETSGQTLNFAGITVDTMAPHGAGGSWLLDPFDLTIDAAAASTIVAALGNSNVTIQTNDESVYNVVDDEPVGIVNEEGNGDITVNSAIVWNTANFLMLSAYRNVNINAVVMSTAGGMTIYQPNNTGSSSGGGPGGALFFNGVQAGELSGNLLVNGSFEQLLPGGGVPTSTDIPGWTLSGNTGFTSICLTNVCGYPAQDGSYYLYEGPVGSDAVLSQSFSDTAGQTLTLSGWLASGGAGPTSDFGFQFNGVQVLEAPTTGGAIPAQPYTYYAVSVPATGHDTFAVTYRQDPGFDAIDNLAVTACTGAACIPVALGTQSGGHSGTTSSGSSGSTSTGTNMGTTQQTVLATTQTTVPTQTEAQPSTTVASLVPTTSSAIVNVPTTGGNQGAGTINSPTDIDTGAMAFATIEPLTGGSQGGGNANPITAVPPITRASSPEPRPEVTEISVGGPGSHVYAATPFVVRHLDQVPGINAPASMSGNRGLWFAAPPENI